MSKDYALEPENSSECKIVTEKVKDGVRDNNQLMRQQSYKTGLQHTHHPTYAVI